jgi:hypothetical protein
MANTTTSTCLPPLAFGREMLTDDIAQPPIRFSRVTSGPDYPRPSSEALIDAPQTPPTGAHGRSFRQACSIRLPPKVLAPHLRPHPLGISIQVAPGQRRS